MLGFHLREHFLFCVCFVLVGSIEIVLGNFKIFFKLSKHRLHVEVLKIADEPMCS